MQVTQLGQVQQRPPVRTLQENPQLSPEKGPQDGVSLGETIKLGALKAVRAGAGFLGAGIGATMGVLPGVAYGVDRRLNSEKLMWNVDTDELSLVPNHHENLDTEAQNVDACWKVSYALVGAAAAGTAAYFGIGPGVGAALCAFAGGALGVGLQAAFRNAGQHTTRLPIDSEYFPVTLSYCADKEMGAHITGPLNGAWVGMREGAHLGKLAFQDLLVPSLRPDRYTPYKP